MKVEVLTETFCQQKFAYPMLTSHQLMKYGNYQHMTLFEILYLL